MPVAVFGRHSGTGGADAKTLVNNGIWSKYFIYGDCSGAFLVWWMPGFWPFMFY